MDKVSESRRNGSDVTRSRSFGVRAFVVMRNRYAEDAVAEATQRGIRQYVVLGAGLDTFAYRNPYAGRVHVLEVDHPSTQVRKRNRLREAGIEIPRSLTFAPINFESQTLAEGLERAGLRTEPIISSGRASEYRNVE